MSTIRANGLEFGNIPVNDAKTLDWYEEGTFTPFVYAETSTNVPNYVYQLGTFTRIGRVVTFTVRIKWGTVTGLTGSGAILFGGFPYACGSNDYAFAVMLENFTFSNSSIVVRMIPNTTTADIWSSSSGTGWSRAGIDATAEAIYSGSYQI